jgi:cellulose synthase/poly-beta-1,6-N-acetylglucosamine synthase-like glycosyltransferase
VCLFLFLTFDPVDYVSAVLLLGGKSSQGELSFVLLWRGWRFFFSIFIAVCLSCLSAGLGVRSFSLLSRRRSAARGHTRHPTSPSTAAVAAAAKRATSDR